VAQPNLPKFDYYLDESDPDVLVLRRQDGSFVSAFSARGATKEGVIEATREDYSALLEEHSGSLGLLRGEDKHESASQSRSLLPPVDYEDVVANL
jgi:hypothetical protein